MNPSNVPTGTRISYALGYLALGMVKDASQELQSIPVAEQDDLPVAKAWVECHMSSRDWLLVIATAQPVTRSDPRYEPAWIAWAYALRELNRVQDAKDVLMDAFPLHHQTSGVLHYNLACYHCLLGDLSEARASLNRASQIDKSWEDAARTDPDLKRLTLS